MNFKAFSHFRGTQKGSIEFHRRAHFMMLFAKSCGACSPQD
jgi:hypothetical protein